jgi:hypothetical protein
MSRGSTAEGVDSFKYVIVHVSCADWVCVCQSAGIVKASWRILVTQIHSDLKEDLFQ